MSGKLRLGVIGAGSWAVGSHLPNLERWRDEVEFTIVNRRDPVILERIRERFAFERATTDWQEVIAAEPDLVVVASPASVHFEQVRAALRAGAHVLCEKPFTVDPGEAWEIVRTADEVGRTVVVAFGWNFNPMTVEAMRVIEANGGLGDIELMTIAMASTARELLTSEYHYDAGDDQVAPKPETWRDPSLSGGGYGQAQLSHALGLGLWLSGCSRPSGARLLLGARGGRGRAPRRDRGPVHERWGRDDGRGVEPPRHRRGAPPDGDPHPGVERPARDRRRA